MPSNSTPVQSIPFRPQPADSRKPERKEGRLERASRVLQAQMAALAAAAEAPRALYSNLVQQEWASNPINPANRKPSGFGPVLAANPNTLRSEPA